MEKPDANGFININWPSTNVHYGGIFHTKVAAPTSGQQEFLKVLLEESKLSITQRKKAKDESLSSIENKRISRISEKRSISIPSIRPHTSRRRSLSTIRASEALDDDQYCPQKRGVDREKMKERLANMMTFGDTERKIAVSPTFGVRPAPKIPTSKEMKNELINQICERMKWLAEMECLGQAEPHKRIINNQITERIRALDALGIDSECSSARSTASGFSTTRSTEKLQLNKPLLKSGPVSVHRRQTKGGSKRSQEENVASYGQLPLLQCSPRRRV